MEWSPSFVTERKKQQSPWVKTLCPGEQLEGEPFPIGITIAYPAYRTTYHAVRSSVRGCVPTQKALWEFQMTASLCSFCWTFAPSLLVSIRSFTWKPSPWGHSALPGMGTPAFKGRPKLVSSRRFQCQEDDVLLCMYVCMYICTTYLSSFLLLFFFFFFGFLNKLIHSKPQVWLS